MIVQCYQLNSCSHEGGDSISDYVAALLKLAERCEYGGILQEMLQDQFICGVTKHRIQKRLLMEATLDFNKAGPTLLQLSAPTLPSHTQLSLDSVSFSPDKVESLLSNLDSLG